MLQAEKSRCFTAAATYSPMIEHAMEFSGGCCALRSLGKKVPEDIAVIGFDGIAETGEFSQQTSIRQNIESVAAESFRIMEKLLRNEIVTGSITPVLPALKQGTTH